MCEKRIAACKIVVVSRLAYSYQDPAHEKINFCVRFFVVITRNCWFSFKICSFTNSYFWLRFLFGHCRSVFFCNVENDVILPPADDPLLSLCYALLVSAIVCATTHARIPIVFVSNQWILLQKIKQSTSNSCYLSQKSAIVRCITHTYAQERKNMIMSMYGQRHLLLLLLRWAFAHFSGWYKSILLLLKVDHHKPLFECVVVVATRQAK